MKKLYKSSTNKVISGVLGGVGEYYNTDPTLLKVAYLLLAVLTAVFPALVAYCVAVVVVPNKPASATAPEHAASTEAH
ncbi:MAG: PspC domain-containing protein [Candidatus Paceibacterota bacterium]